MLAVLYLEHTVGVFIYIYLHQNCSTLPYKLQI